MFQAKFPHLMCLHECKHHLLVEKMAFQLLILDLHPCRPSMTTPRHCRRDWSWSTHSNAKMCGAHINSYQRRWLLRQQKLLKCLISCEWSNWTVWSMERCIRCWVPSPYVLDQRRCGYTYPILFLWASMTGKLTLCGMSLHTSVHGPEYWHVYVC